MARRRPRPTGFGSDADSCLVGRPDAATTERRLLLGRVRWRDLFSGAVATGVCVTGLSVFSAWLFSGQILSSDRDYGSIGVVTVLMSYMIGYGVCLHTGAVAGRVWAEQRQPASADNENAEPSPLKSEHVGPELEAGGRVPADGMTPRPRGAVEATLVGCVLLAEAERGWSQTGRGSSMRSVRTITVLGVSVADWSVHLKVRYGEPSSVKS